SRESIVSKFKQLQPMQQAIQYQAAGARRIDALDVYTTDGRLVLYNLTVLKEDKGFFPPYQAVPLARGATLRRHPEIAQALALLGGALDEDRMRALNLRLQEKHESEVVVARDALAELGLGGGARNAEAEKGPRARSLS